MSHRWNAEKAYKWEKRQEQWDLQRPDLLLPFLRMLPEPLSFDVEDIPNNKGKAAQLYKLKYAEASGRGQIAYHGTWVGGVFGIISQGFRERAATRLCTSSPHPLCT